MSNVNTFSKEPRWRRKGRYRKIMFVVLTTVYLGVVFMTLMIRATNSSSEREQATNQHRRYKRDVIGQELNVGADADEPKNCTPRAVNEFPDNFISLKATQDGGVVAHIVLALYMFGSLAIVCDDYFVPSLELISERLHLQEDVAGATFMAAGSSAPEFFTSFIGVFIAKSDVGLGTIVGSAIFNILFIIGACGMFAGMVVRLTWWPMMRDSSVYLISVLVLVIVIQDDNVHWYEAAVMVVLYILYIVIMYFNRTLEEKARNIMDNFKKRRGIGQHDGEDDEQIETEKQPLIGDTKHNGDTSTRQPGKDEIVLETSLCRNDSGSISISDDDAIDSPWTVPDNLPLLFYWMLMLPVKVLMYVTVPDCRRPGCIKNLYPVTFFMSIVWIAGCSYIMVWMVTIAGDALEIPDTVMGLTILAAGTSVPDCLSSIFVARDGFGDMAVSNSIGSNVFDILMCLGLPWLLDTLINSGEPLVIQSGAIIYSALTLFATVIFMVIAINVVKWQLTKSFGAICFVVYIAVIALTCLYELNVFGDFTKPTCPRE